MNQIFEDHQALSQAAAELFVARARQAQQARGLCVVALSGGGTPRRMLELLAGPPLREQVDWPRVVVFWSDERCVPPGDPRHNALHARQLLLDHVPVDPRLIHPLHCHGAPGRAAEAYEALIRAVFQGRPPRFDLIYLGLGGDGHTASLFPGSEVLAEQHRLVREAPTAQGEPDRVTFTPALINQAAMVVFLVSGQAKAAVVRAVQQGPTDLRRLPAQAIRPLAGSLAWLLDRAAASELR